MLRMSKLTDYGVVIMSHLARTPQQALSAAQVAAQVGIAQPTVSKILKILAREGLLSSARGLKGGYCLALPAAEISLSDLIHALEGPLALTECGQQGGLCQMEQACSIRNNWRYINRMIHETLSGISLAQMNKPIRTR